MIRFYTLLFICVSIKGYSQLAFQDSATSAGVGMSYGSSYLGGGVSFCDFNDDGWDDLTYSTTDGEEVTFLKIMVMIHSRRLI